MNIDLVKRLSVKAPAFWPQLVQRFKAATPKFYFRLLKRLLIIFGSLSTLCGGILTLHGGQMDEFTEDALKMGVGLGVWSMILSFVLTQLPIDWEQVTPAEIPDVPIPNNVSIESNSNFVQTNTTEHSRSTSSITELVNYPESIPDNYGYPIEQ